MCYWLIYKVNMANIYNIPKVGLSIKFCLISDMKNENKKVAIHRQALTSQTLTAIWHKIEINLDLTIFVIRV